MQVVLLDSYSQIQAHSSSGWIWQTEGKEVASELNGSCVCEPEQWFTQTPYAHTQSM